MCRNRKTEKRKKEGKNRSTVTCSKIHTTKITKRARLFNKKKKSQDTILLDFIRHFIRFKCVTQNTKIKNEKKNKTIICI